MMNSDINEQQIWGRVYAALKSANVQLQEIYEPCRKIDFEKLLYEIEEAIECGDLKYCDEILRKIGF